MNLHEGEWCCVEKEGGAEAAEVEEVLQRMHGEASEGLDVGVPVVDAVDVLVHGGNVDKSETIKVIKIRQIGGCVPVCKIEVELSVERHPEGGGNEDA